MTKVMNIMSRNLARVDYSTNLLEATKVMSEKGSNGILVEKQGKPVGMLTERSILHRFVSMNVKPSDVQVGKIIGPLLKIDEDASTTTAARKLVENHLSRMGVLKDDKLVGWVTLSDIGRVASKNRLVDTLLQRHKTKTEEFICPNCKLGVLRKVVSRQGNILRWECPNCVHAE